MVVGTSNSIASYTVLQVDPETGTTLAADGAWAVGGNEYYRPFDSREQAEAFCEERLRERPDTEWCIFAGDNRTQAIKVYRDDAYHQARVAERVANRPVSLGARIRNWLARPTRS